MARQQFGNTWWGNRWLHALHQIDRHNRLPRGRRYANNGSVQELTIEGGTVTAKVAGSRPRPYSVKLEVPVMGSHERKQLVAALAAEPALIGRLLNRELDPAVLDHAERLNIAIFPAQWRDLHMRCSCPDIAVPCKHLAAVVYTLSREIDGDPFMVFRLRGIDLPATLRQRGLQITSEAEGKPPILDKLIPARDDDTIEGEGDPDDLASIDYTLLPDLREALPQALAPHPPFSPTRDFRKVWQTYMRRIAKSASRHLEQPRSAADSSPTDANAAARRQALDEGIELELDRYGDLALDRPTSETDLAGLLAAVEALSDDDLLDYRADVAGLHATHRAALHLLAAGAAVPALYTMSHEGTGLLWLPATLHPAAEGMIERLALGLPSGILRLQQGRRRRRLPRRIQARLLCGLIMDHYIRTWAGIPEGQRNDRIIDLFFGSGAAPFDGPGEGAEAVSIRAWLARLHLSEREHSPVLCLEESDDHTFTLAIDVASARDPEARVALADVLQDPAWAQARGGILQVVSMLAESYPPLHEYVSAGAREPLQVTPADLPELLFEILPVVRLLGIRTLLPRSLERIQRPHASMKVTSKPKESGGFLRAGDLFRFDWRVTIGDEIITREEFEELVDQSTGIVRFRGQYAYLDPQQMERLRRQLDKPPRVSGAELTRTALAESYGEAPIQLDHVARERVEALRSVGESPLPEGIQAELRPYQIRGFRWLYQNACAGLGSVIADDMGLGKTLQVLATILRLKEDGALAERGGVLVVVPTSLLTNWCREIERFTPALDVHLYHGPAREAPDGSAEVVLTSYGHARSDPGPPAHHPRDLRGADQRDDPPKTRTLRTDRHHRRAVDRQPERSRAGGRVHGRVNTSASRMDLPADRLADHIPNHTPRAFPKAPRMRHSRDQCELTIGREGHGQQR